MSNMENNDPNNPNLTYLTFLWREHKGMEVLSHHRVEIHTPPFLNFLIATAAKNMESSMGELHILEVDFALFFGQAKDEFLTTTVRPLFDVLKYPRSQVSQSILIR